MFVFVLNIDGQAAKHGVGSGRERRERVEDKFVWGRFALFDGEG
jgi:hypothetical protein